MNDFETAVEFVRAREGRYTLGSAARAICNGASGDVMTKKWEKVLRRLVDVGALDRRVNPEASMRPNAMKLYVGEASWERATFPTRARVPAGVGVPAVGAAPPAGQDSPEDPYDVDAPVFPCPDCDREYPTQAALDRHAERQHPKPAEPEPLDDSIAGIFNRKPRPNVKYSESTKGLTFQGRVSERPGALGPKDKKPSIRIITL